MNASRRAAAFASTVALVGALAACSSGLSVPSSPGPTSSSPVPTVACPVIEGVELPPECVPYDPDAAMAENDRYRERIDIGEEAEKSGAALVRQVEAALEALRSEGEIRADDVAAALEATGATSPQVREDYGRILFGAVAPTGGCVFGDISDDTVSVDIGGFIMDGGCLPAQ